MRTILASCVLICAAAASPAHCVTCPEQTADESSAQAQAAFAAWNDGVRHKDLEKTMDVFSQSIRFQIQGLPDIGYPRLLEKYTAAYAREDTVQWLGFIENVVGSPQMVTLLTVWKLMPVEGGDAISEYRGVDVFQRESDCAWRIAVSLNYVDAATISHKPERYSPGPATVRSDNTHPKIAWREPAVRDLDFVFGHH